MNKPVQKIDYKDHVIHIFQDPNPTDPLEWDNYGTFYCFHKRYNLGHPTDVNPGDFESWDEMEEALCSMKDIVCIEPLYIYDHSGITIRTTPFSSHWDSGRLGFVFVTRQSVKMLQGWERITQKRKKDIRKWMLGEVETYDKYLRGDVYGYQVFHKDDLDDHLDSCWGFYGWNEWEENGLFDHAKGDIDWRIKDQREKYFDRLKTVIRNHVPINKRPELIHKPLVLS